MPPKGSPSRLTTLHFCRIALSCSSSSLFCRLFSHWKALTHVLQVITAQNPRFMPIMLDIPAFSDPQTLKYRESAANLCRILPYEPPLSPIHNLIVGDGASPLLLGTLASVGEHSARDADNTLFTTLFTAPSPINGFFVREPTRSADPAT